MKLMNAQIASKVAVLLLQRHYGVSAAGTVLEDVQALDSLLKDGTQVYVVVNDIVERHDLFRTDRPTQTHSQPIGFDEQFAAFVTVSHEVMLAEDAAGVNHCAAVELPAGLNVNHCAQVELPAGVNGHNYGVPYSLADFAHSSPAKKSGILNLPVFDFLKGK